jgi:hypothetical protein
LAKPSDSLLVLAGRYRPWRAVLAAAIAAVVCGAMVGAEIIDRVVATVGSRTVTLSDVRAALALGLVSGDAAGEPDEPVVRAVTDRVLMALEVDRYGGSLPDEAAVRRRVDALTARLGETGLANVMLRVGLDEPRLRALVGEDLAIERYVDERFGGAAEPAEDDVREYYVAHQGAFMRGGAPIPFVEAEAAARAALVAERTRALVAEWLVDLRRRTPVDIKPAAHQR